jgi:hypothetical protein
LVIEQGLSIAQAARDLGINDKQILRTPLPPHPTRSTASIRSRRWQA